MESTKDPSGAEMWQELLEACRCPQTTQKHVQTDRVVESTKQKQVQTDRDVGSMEIQNGPSALPRLPPIMFYDAEGVSKADLAQAKVFLKHVAIYQYVRKAPQRALFKKKNAKLNK